MIDKYIPTLCNTFYLITRLFIIEDLFLFLFLFTLYLKNIITKDLIDLIIN